MIALFLLLTACGPTADEVYQEANRHFASENFKAAIPIYEQLLIRDANNLNVHAKLAIAYGRTGDWAKCADSGTAALANKVELYEIYLQTGHCFEQLKQPAQALDMYGQGQKKFPDRLDLTERVALLHYQQKQFPQASALFKELSDAAPGNAEYAYNAASVLEAQKQYDVAETYYRRVLEHDPKHANASFGLGSVFEKRGEDEIALGFYEKALKYNPAHLSALLNLAQLQEPRQPRKALESWKSYLKLAQEGKQPEKFIRQAQERIRILEGGSKAAQNTSKR